MSTYRDEPPDVLQPPHETYAAEIFRRCWDRMHRTNQHNMVAVVGEEGSGKSYTALKMADVIDPTFSDSVTDRVLFQVSDLLRILNEGNHEPGQAYVLDEAGVSLGRRTWQERGQILANQALQLIRSHNLSLFFTIPRLGELDSQTQGRLQAFFEITEKIEGEYVKGTWLYLDPDRRDSTGEIYTKKPRVRQNGQRIRVDSLKFAPPDPALTDVYDEKKAEHQQRIYEETIEELEGKDDSDDDTKDVTAKEIANDILDAGTAEDYVLEYNNGAQSSIDKDLIAAEYEVGREKAKRVKKLLKRERADQ